MVSRRTASRDQLTNSPSSRLSKVQQPEIERVSDAALTPQLPLKPVEGRKDKTRQLGVAFQTEDRESPSLRNQERRAGQPPPMKCRGTWLLLADPFRGQESVTRRHRQHKRDEQPRRHGRPEARAKGDDSSRYNDMDQAIHAN